jgi:hypothetical protein
MTSSGLGWVSSLIYPTGSGLLRLIESTQPRALYQTATRRPENRPNRTDFSPDQSTKLSTKSRCFWNCLPRWRRPNTVAPWQGNQSHVPAHILRYLIVLVAQYPHSFCFYVYCFSPFASADRVVFRGRLSFLSPRSLHHSTLGFPRGQSIVIQYKNNLSR